jgi:hypothetical protein
MGTHMDPVDDALQSLVGRQWPGANHNPELEQRLMQNFENPPPVSLLARHKILVSVLAVLLLAGVSFAAAGGVELIRSWFLTIQVNGTVVHSGEIQVDEHGQDTLTLPKGSLQADQNGQVTVGLEMHGDASDGPQANTISITDGEKEVIVRVGSQPPPPENAERDVAIEARVRVGSESGSAEDEQAEQPQTEETPAHNAE